MKCSQINNLVCPDCRGPLAILEDKNAETTDTIITGAIGCSECGRSYPIIRGIPRFVSDDNYAENFGFQWNHFRLTQLDSHSGLQLSHDRFYQQTKWDPALLTGKNILDIGCGAGRFTEIAIASGAQVHAVDYSEAVDACANNLDQSENLHLFQADIYRLPFPEDYFDYVFCFGVLQHTPDVKTAFLSLTSYVKPGGSIAVDLYEKKWKNYLRPKFWLRPITTRMPKATLFRILHKTIPTLLSLNKLLRKIPVIGVLLTRITPVADYTNIYPLSEKQIEEWALLDTFDWLGPAYDSPQSVVTLREWFNFTDLENVEIDNPNFVVGRGQRKGKTLSKKSD